MVDGTSNTIMLVLGRPEALSKSWTSTGSDYEVNPDNPAAGMYQTSNGVYLVLFADGSAQRISTSIDPVTLNNLMMRNDGNVADAFMFSE